MAWRTAAGKDLGHKGKEKTQIMGYQRLVKDGQVPVAGPTQTMLEALLCCVLPPLRQLTCCGMVLQMGCGSPGRGDTDRLIHIVTYRLIHVVGYISSGTYHLLGSWETHLVCWDSYAVSGSGRWASFSASPRLTPTKLN